MPESFRLYLRAEKQAQPLLVSGTARDLPEEAYALVTLLLPARQGRIDKAAAAKNAHGARRAPHYPGS